MSALTKKSQFSKANLGYLDKFLGGKLEAKLALNNLNFKCCVQFFLSEHSLGRKIRGALCAPSQSFMFGKKCRPLRVKFVSTKNTNTFSKIHKRHPKLCYFFFKLD